MTTAVALTTICQRERYRAVDETKALDLARSMERQGLLQPIGVRPCQCAVYQESHYQLLFGAHRLRAAEHLAWPEIEATIFDEALSEEMGRLAELQENSARHDLTGSQRKQFAAEIGRLLSTLAEKSNSPDWTDTWLEEIGLKIGASRSAMYNWWHAFCKETGYAITPSQALEGHKEQFFDWLEDQHRKAEEEKARKEQEARERRQRESCTQAVEYLASLVERFGYAVVDTQILAVFYARYRPRQEPTP